MPNARSGFSLVELLVVAAVIALLAGFAMEGAAHARGVAGRAACASNLRQIGAALLVYAGDHDGWLPETTHNRSLSNAWIQTLAPYLGNLDAVRICPADPRRQERLAAGGTSYLVNEFVFVDQRDAFGQLGESWRNLYRLPFPARTMTVFPVADTVPPSPMNDHTHSRNWRKGWGAVIRDIQPDRHRRGASPSDRLGGLANYLYADGHVAGIRAEELKREFDAGRNPARPPES